MVLNRCDVSPQNARVRESITLSEMEIEMNVNERLHPMKDVEAEAEDEELDDLLRTLKYEDTCITACPRCGKRVINFGLHVHSQEFHSGGILSDFDDDVANM
mmetsp:Transcript_9270/g.20023  ORF Transcript_9270/g.20023 Transcript_9270/m.20023 type:complete len:102 (+) Transcript_9270:1650-1955(+)